MDKKELDKLVKELEELHIQQKVLIKKIRASTEGESTPDRPAPSTTQDESETPFRVGQRVLIKNRLSHVVLATPE